MSEIGGLFGNLEGQEIPGGCETCDAFQTVQVEESGVIHLVVHHDDWCPFLRAREARSN